MAAARDGDDIHSFLSASGVRLQRPSPRSSAEEFSNSHASLSLLTSPALSVNFHFFALQGRDPFLKNFET